MRKYKYIYNSTNVYNTIDCHIVMSNGENANKWFIEENIMNKNNYCITIGRDA